MLVVDDDPAICRLVRGWLGADTQSWEAADATAGIDILLREAPDVAFVDVVMPGGGGREFMEEVRRYLPSCAIVGISGQANVGQFVELFRLGMADFLAKPLERHALLAAIPRALRVRAMRDQIARACSDDGSPDAEAPFASLVGASPRWIAMMDLLRRVAPLETGVLLVGPAGCGKALAARSIHAASPRASRPFVVVSCGALAPSLTETELFGHAAGAFTGAGGARAGALESASGGTAVLAEIGALPLDAQAGLLRAVEERAVQRVGESVERSVDLRFMATSTEDPDSLVAQGRLRADFLHRLNRQRIDIPPLADREDDLLLLAAHLLGGIARRAQRRVPVLSPRAIKSLRAHAWPGNVRELGNVLEHACIASAWANVLDDHHLRIYCGSDTLPRLDPGSWPFPEAGLSLPALLHDVEADFLKRALARAGGHHERAAALLRLPRSTFERRLAPGLDE